jgi:hypothetical protein
MKRFSEDARKKMSNAKLGTKNPNWKGGIYANDPKGYMKQYWKTRYSRVHGKSVAAEKSQ